MTRAMRCGMKQKRVGISAIPTRFHFVYRTLAATYRPQSTYAAIRAMQAYQVEPLTQGGC